MSFAHTSVTQMTVNWCLNQKVCTLSSIALGHCYFYKILQVRQTARHPRSCVDHPLFPGGDRPLCVDKAWTATQSGLASLFF